MLTPEEARDLQELLEYELPEELIAQEPLADRSGSRLLVVPREPAPLQHAQFRDLPSFLQPGDLLVMNDTKVTCRRLFGALSTGGKVEVLLLGQQPSLRGGLAFEVLCRPAKRLKVGTKFLLEEDLEAEVIAEGEGGLRVIDFAPRENLSTQLDTAGEIPLPPYIHQRLAEEGRYQTVYAQTPGSSAAPTAGLHFTPNVMEAVQERGVRLAYVTLDVGIDTFRPLGEGDFRDHKMHGERCRISAETASLINSCCGRVIAVGTTSARTLESFGVAPGQVQSGDKTSELYITPGYQFQVVQGLITNFHLPRTTLLLMISALMSPGRIRDAYKEAIEKRYRFLSFGDSMVLFP